MTLPTPADPKDTASAPAKPLPPQTSVPPLPNRATKTNGQVPVNAETGKHESKKQADAAVAVGLPPGSPSRPFAFFSATYDDFIARTEAYVEYKQKKTTFPLSLPIQRVILSEGVPTRGC